MFSSTILTAYVLWNKQYLRKAPSLNVIYEPMIRCLALWTTQYHLDFLRTGVLIDQAGAWFQSGRGLINQAAAYFYHGGCLIDQAAVWFWSGSGLIDQEAAWFDQAATWPIRLLPDFDEAAAWQIRQPPDFHIFWFSPVNV